MHCLLHSLALQLSHGAKALDQKMQCNLATAYVHQASSYDFEQKRDTRVQWEAATLAANEPCHRDIPLHTDPSTIKPSTHGGTRCGRQPAGCCERLCSQQMPTGNEPHPKQAFELAALGSMRVSRVCRALYYKSSHACASLKQPTAQQPAPGTAGLGAMRRTCRARPPAG